MLLKILAFTLMGSGGCALFVVAADPDWSQVDWGDVPTWIVALTTLGVLIAAGVLLRGEVGRDHRVLAADAERRDKEAAAEEERREREASSHQADHVAAWCGQADNQTRDHKLFFGNGSALPVYDVVVTWVLPDGATLPQEPYALMGPGRTVDAIPSDVLEARTERFPDLNSWEFAGKLKVGIRFRDTAGRVWERDAKGVLSQSAG